MVRTVDFAYNLISSQNTSWDYASFFITVALQFLEPGRVLKP